VLTRLKVVCEAAVPIKEDAIEIQGQHLEQIRTLLAEMRYKSKG